MAITKEMYEGNTMWVSTSRMSDALSIMFYRIEKEVPAYEIEIYSPSERAETEEINWRDYDADYQCGDVGSSAFLVIDQVEEVKVPSDCYYSDGTIVFHAQINRDLIEFIKVAQGLQIKILIPGLKIFDGNNLLILMPNMLREWQKILL